MQTVDYLGTLQNAQNAANFAPFLTYVYPKSDQFQAWRAAGVKTVRYIDPSMPQGSDLETTSGLAAQYVTAMAHDCAGNLIKTYGGTGTLSDPHAANALTYYQAAIDLHKNQISTWNAGVVPDAYFSDNSNDIYGASATPCTFTTFTDWSNATKSVLSGVNVYGAQFFINSLTLSAGPNATVADLQIPLAAPPVTGAEDEFCYWDALSHWSSTETLELATIRQGKVFWCYNRDNGAITSQPPENVVPQRMFAYASFLLTYDPALTIFQEWLTTPSGFKVMPETGIVALAPVQTAANAVTELQRGGVYIREFSACYYRAVPIGACAAVVNPGTAAAAVSLPAYAHSVVLDGSDAADGGSVAWNGPAITTLAPGAAAIVTP